MKKLFIILMMSLPVQGYADEIDNIIRNRQQAEANDIAWKSLVLQAYQIQKSNNCSSKAARIEQVKTDIEWMKTIVSKCDGKKACLMQILNGVDYSKY